MLSHIVVNLFIVRVHIYFSLTVSNVLIGLQRTEIMVAEDMGFELVCVEIVSEDTLVSEAAVDIVSRDGSAVSNSMY